VKGTAMRRLLAALSASAFALVILAAIPHMYFG
jgi:hypothetical protein